jgi:cytoskeletal protein CcmA (bactofilin family)
VTASVGDDDGFTVGKADVDLYAFTAPFGGTFTFAAEPSDAFGADPYLRVFDAAGTELAHDDNGGTTTNGNTGGARIRIDLSAGQTYLIGVNGAGPNAGAYNPITGAGAAESDNTGGYVLEATTDTRTLSFGGKTKATYTDATGDEVTVSLKGPGTGTVFFDGTAVTGDAARIEVDGATLSTTLSIKGDTTIGGLTINGSVKSAGGKSVDLTGDLAVTGDAKALTFRNVTNADLTIGGSATPVSVTAVGVTDSSITSAAPLKSLKVAFWDDAGADDAVAAPTVSAVASKGNFAAAIRAESVGKVSVGGTLGGDVRSTGSIASLTVGALAAVTVYAGVAEGVVLLPDAPVAFGVASAVLKSFTVKGKDAGSFAAGAIVAAPTIGKASIGTAITSNGGTAFGLAADAIGSVSGATDVGGKFKLKKLTDAAQTFAAGDFTVRVV